jgi:dTDP-glucose pyrophosphorylase
MISLLSGFTPSPAVHEAVAVLKPSRRGESEIAGYWKDADHVTEMR